MHTVVFVTPRGKTSQRLTNASLVDLAKARSALGQDGESYLTFGPPARSSGTNRLRAGIITAGSVFASITAFSAIIPFFARRKAVRL